MLKTILKENFNKNCLCNIYNKIKFKNLELCNHV